MPSSPTDYPTLSVIVRTVNRPRLLHRALHSLVEQTRKPDEVVVINDGGAAVDAVIAEFDPDLTIQHVRNATGQGRSAAGNQGVDLATSQFIAFLDDDDRFLPRHLERLAGAVAEFDARVAYSGCRLVLRDVLGDDGEVMRETPLGVFNDPFDPERLRHENYIPLINLLIDKTLWTQQGGFDLGFDLFEDWDLLLRLAGDTRFFHVDCLTSEYGKWGSEQITQTQNVERWVAAYRQFLAKHWLPLEADEQLDRLARYWRLSQERRGVIHTVREDNTQLKLNLADKQNAWHAAQQQSLALQQQVGNWQHQAEGLQDQLRAQQQQIHDQQDQAREAQRQYRALEEAKAEEQKTAREAYRALEQAAATEQQKARQAYAALEREYQELQTEHREQTAQSETTLADYQEQLATSQAETHHARAALHELHKQLVLGMTQEQLRQILLHQRPWFAHPARDHGPLFDAIWEWRERQQQPLRAALAQLKEETSGLVPALDHLHGSVRELTDKAVNSRILHRLGYVKIIDQVNGALNHLSTQVQRGVERANHLPVMDTPALPPAPPARAPGRWTPSLALFGGEPQRVFLEAPARGDTPVMLDADTVLSFLLPCPENGLSRIEISLGTYQRLNHCRLRLLLRHAEPPHAVVREVVLFALSVVDNAFQAFTFEPLADSGGRTYLLELSSPDADEDNAVAVWCADAPRPAQSGESFPLPEQFPRWMRETLRLEPGIWRAEGEVDHLFIVNRPQDPTRVHLLLGPLAQGLDPARARVVLCVDGSQSLELKEWARAQGWAMEEANPLVVAKREASSCQWIWLLNDTIAAAPEHISRAERVFAETDAALVIPQLVNNDGSLHAGHAQITASASLQSLGNGLPAGHPYQNYRRPTLATVIPLAVLRAARVAGFEERPYQTLEYALTDWIWQGGAVYEPALSLTQTAPWSETTPAQIQADADCFLEHWAEALSSHPWLPRQLRQPHNPEGKPEILVVDATLPTFDQDSGSLRMFTLMKLLVDLGWRVTFFPDNLDSDPRYRRPLEALGIEVFHGAYTLGDAVIHRNYSHAIVCRVDIGQRFIPFLRTVSPDTQILYDTVDIHYVRELRQAEIENNPELAKNAQATRRKELANCVLADCVLTVTDDDGKHLQQEIPSLPYFVLPNVHLAPPPPKNGYAERAGLVFIGNYNHQPNEDSVLYFVETVLPKIREALPEVQFHVVGSNLKPSLAAIQDPAVDIVGWVDEVAPEFEQRRVFVSYLRYGAGMKGKLGQALSLGLPVVSTTVGAEGMGLQNEETALIADDPDTFAAAVARLYQDEALWQTLSDQGRAHIEARYGESAVRDKLQDLLQS